MGSCGRPTALHLHRPHRLQEPTTTFLPSQRSRCHSTRYQRADHRGHLRSGDFASLFVLNKRRPLPHQRSSSGVRVAASSSDSGVTKRQRLPIFPLGLVALPGTNVPLQIFEARYRVLFSTLLDGSDGIDQGLVSPDKPWRGTRRFGMVLYDSNAGGLATVGTVLEVVDHSTMDDGRLLVQTIGRERFKISEVVEERPILVCDVELLNDAEMLNEDPEKAKELADQIGTLFREMVKLTVKLRGSTVPDEVQDPVELRTLAPRELSFWVASLFGGNPYNQQALLEEDCTMKRLKVEEELLSETLKYLSAQAAVKSAFGSEPDQKSE